eukprot:TRINITY_DN5499_c0_g2_i1.p1 TRINITY_DN5499_c0_g2~~TRINITY_DN5499_c0_g2_i1.p1  ORF type:complete len:297 (+),score=25.93 TRINITY_DN5499_c0_g2_i1:81-893(+)
MSRQELMETEVEWPYATERDSKELKKEDVITILKYAEELFEMSANLTELEKVIIYSFDSKIRTLGTLPFEIPIVEFPLEQVNEDDTIQILADIGTIITIYDATVLAWKEKLRHDAVRPQSIIKKLLQDEKVRAWGGEGKGATEILAQEFVSYIRTMPHSEYPSGSSCACEAVMQYWREYLGRDELARPLAKSFIKNTFTTLPDLPEKNTVVIFRTLTEYSQLCGESRLWGGFHFRPAVEAGYKLCRDVGTKAYKTMMAKTNNGVPQVPQR